MPHPPLRTTVFPTNESFCPPTTSIPVPIGTRAVVASVGLFGLLLSWTRLPRKIVHEPVPSGPGSRFGHAPPCGDGWSSLFRLFGATPTRLKPNSESCTMRWPPEFVPEYPRPLFTPTKRSTTVLQSGQAPMYRAASAMLLE